jgi:ribonuclease T2
MQNKSRNNNSRGQNKPVTWASFLAAVVLLVIYLVQQMGEAPAEIQPQIPKPAATQAAAETTAEAAVPPTEPANPGETAVAAEQPAMTESPAINPGNPPAAIGETGSDFDFYMLALSWSPDYCESQNDTRSQQCKIGRRLGFVLHGLWPNYTKGYPSFCSNEKLPASLKQTYAGLYPSTSLFDHEWEKHGTCSGLPPEEYLAFSKAIQEKVAIPAAYRTPEQPVRVTPQQFKEQFAAVNPGLGADGLAVFCSGSGRFLSEMRVCFTPGGEFTHCSEETLKDSARSCGRSDFLVRNVR